MIKDPSPTSQDPRRAILKAAEAAVRRFGAERTRVTDIARSIGVSHSTLYRHFPSRTDIFTAIVQQVMDDEVELATNFVDAPGPAADRLRGMIVELHRRKRARFNKDRELHSLYRIIAADRLSIMNEYARRMTSLVARIIRQGQDGGEFAQCDTDIAASAFADAVTIFVHPAMLEFFSGKPAGIEARMTHVIDLALNGLRSGTGTQK
ncbi:MAG: TetR family transcriptional regulator [Sphingobium sp.]|jgi:AcrR family transcriptional regulator|nr:TetR family transcriptional regulator [Sphingobium sp.]MCI1754646.1 TetR family transcriptional regulator [Sphingobium sp.]MCI2054186.1 TetR family transcriptional regulator [Sphingobium sp.]